MSSSIPRSFISTDNSQHSSKKRSGIGTPHSLNSASSVSRKRSLSTLDGVFDSNLPKRRIQSALNEIWNPTGVGSNFKQFRSSIFPNVRTESNSSVSKGSSTLNEAIEANPFAGRSRFRLNGFGLQFSNPISKSSSNPSSILDNFQPTFGASNVDGMALDLPTSQVYGFQSQGLLVGQSFKTSAHAVSNLLGGSSVWNDAASNPQNHFDQVSITTSHQADTSMRHLFGTSSYIPNTSAASHRAQSYASESRSSQHWNSDQETSVSASPNAIFSSNSSQAGSLETFGDYPISMEENEGSGLSSGSLERVRTEEGIVKMDLDREFINTGSSKGKERQKDEDVTSTVAENPKSQVPKKKIRPFKLRQMLSSADLSSFLDKIYSTDISFPKDCRLEKDLRAPILPQATARQTRISSMPSLTKQEVAIVQIGGLKLPLLPHQSKLVKFFSYLKKNPIQIPLELGKGSSHALLNAMAPGMGKTAATLGCIAYQLGEGGGEAVKPVLVYCPVSCLETWKTETKKFLDKKVKVFVATDENLKELQKSKSLTFFIDEKFDLIILASSRLLTTQSSLDLLLKRNLSSQSYSLLVMDDLAALGDESSKTSLGIQDIKTDFRMILNGTPIKKATQINKDGEAVYSSEVSGLLSNLGLGQETKRFLTKKLSDLQYYNVMRFLLWDICFCIKSYDKDPNGNPLVKIPVVNAFKVKVSQTVDYDDFLVKKSNVLGNNGSHPEALGLMLGSKKLSRAYKDLTIFPGFDAKAKDYTVLSTLIGLLLKIKLNNKHEKTVIIAENPDTLEQVGSSLKEFSILSSKFCGGDSSSVITRFNDSSSVEKVLLLSVGVGEVGINLNSAKNVILLDQAWDFSTTEQSVKRVDRLGNVEDFINVFRVVAGDADEVLIKHQETKKDVLDLMLNEFLL